MGSEYGNDEARSEGSPGQEEAPSRAERCGWEQTGTGLGMSPRGDLACWMIATAAPGQDARCGSGGKYYTGIAARFPGKSIASLGLGAQARTRREVGSRWGGGRC